MTRIQTISLLTSGGFLCLLVVVGIREIADRKTNSQEEPYSSTQAVVSEERLSHYVDLIAGPDVPEPERTYRIEQLIVLIGDEQVAKSHPLLIFEAIRKLGELEAKEAAPALAERLDFRRNERTLHIRDLEFTYPAVKALVAIGEPAIDAIMRAVADRERSSLFCSTASGAILRITAGPDGHYDHDRLQELMTSYSAAYSEQNEPEMARRIRRLSDPFGRRSKPE